MKLKKLRLDFVSSSVLEGKTKEKRINFILNKVKDGSVLVTDAVLHPEEEMDLIKETMRRVDDGFPGIEVCSLKKERRGIQFLIENINEQRYKLIRFIENLTGKKNWKPNLKTGITLIGPAKIIKRIKKNPDSFSVLAEV
ncbi:MAG: DUF2073 domain-containing protein [Candidatus Aenigmatarchaeota archaeon]